MGKLIYISRIGKNAREKMKGKKMLDFLYNNILESNNLSQMIFSIDDSIEDLYGKMEYISKLNKEDEDRKFTLIINNISNKVNANEIISKIDKLLSESIDIVFIRDVLFLDSTLDSTDEILKLYSILDIKSDKQYTLFSQEFYDKIITI